MGQRHETGCPSCVCRGEGDRGVIESNLAHSEEAGSLAIRQQGIEGIDGLPLVAWSLDLEDHLDALGLWGTPVWKRTIRGMGGLRRGSRDHSRDHKAS
jgi:hypothetical protein